MRKNGRRAFLRGGVAALALTCGSSAWAGGVQTIETVEVTDSADNLIGSADTATQGTVLQQQLESRPVYREGELLENVPGLIVTQHSGEGKANQYYLRGFNLDHGTDLAITVDGMPVNMPTHGHGQGYADLNFMIPELMSGMKYQKGPYFADQGDFSAAGSVRIEYLDTLDRSISQVGGGSFGYARGFTAVSHQMGEGNLLAALELNHLDGPWVRSDNYRKENGVLRYSQGTNTNGWGVTAMAYNGSWNATNQIPETLVNSGQLGYFGTMDPSDGGSTRRLSLSTHFVRTDKDSQVKVNAYIISSHLDLFNNFTYYLSDSVNGDQFHQKDSRLIEGGEASYTRFSTLSGLETQNTIGVQTRNDQIDVGLFQTKNRQYVSTTRTDRIEESNAALYLENKTAWNPKIRTVFGVRGDVFHAHDKADDPADQSAGIYASANHNVSQTTTKVSPKASLILGPWARTEFYVSAGEGYHSNDVRSAAFEVQAENTSSGPAPAGTTVKYPLLERASGYEIGVRSTPLPHWQTSLAVFQLHLASEQVFSGDSGGASPSGASTRTGIEFANFYTPIPGVIFDTDIAVSRARFDHPVYDGTTVAGEDGQTVTCCTGKYVAGSPAMVIGSGLALDGFGPWFGGVQYRYYGARPLANDNSVRSPSTSLINTRVGYKLTDAVTAHLDVNNLFNQKMQDIGYYYLSKTSPSATPTTDVHFHAAEPFGVRLFLTVKW